MSTSTSSTGPRPGGGRSSTKESKKSQSQGKAPPPSAASAGVSGDPPPVNPEAKTPNQPTPEQMRIANLMNDKTDFTDLHVKVEQIMQITGSSRDQAVVALHDCDNELNKAVEMILEGDSVQPDEWKQQPSKRTAKPKKIPPGPGPHHPQQSKDQHPSPATNANDEHKTHNVNGSGERRHGNRGVPRAPRLQRGGSGQSNNHKHSSWKPREEKHENFDTNENVIPDNSTTNSILPPRRGERDRDGAMRGGRGGRGRGGGNVGRGMGPGAPGSGGFVGSRGERDKDRGERERGRGTRTFQNRGLRNSSLSTNDSGFPNSIDTWTNITAEQAGKKPSANLMTVGNWSDVVGNEADGSEEDYDSMIMETKVFTPSAKAVTDKNELPDLASLGSSTTVSQAGQGLDMSSVLMAKATPNDPSNQQSMSSILGRNNNAANAAGAALLQQLQQKHASTQQSSQQIYLQSQLNKQAAESIKSLVGITSSAYNNTAGTNSLLSSTANMNRGTGVGVAPQARAPASQVHDQHHSQQQSKPPRMTSTRRSTKIPESAVEMPSNDSISSLNVQFGALDFGTDSSVFGLGTGSGPGVELSANAFQEAVNHVSNVSKNKAVTTGQSSAGGVNLSSNLSSSALLNPESSYRGVVSSVSGQTVGDASGAKTSSASESIVKSSVLGHQSIGSSADAVLDRNVVKSSGGSSYGNKTALDSSHAAGKSSDLYSTGSTVQLQSLQSSSGAPDMTTGYNKGPYGASAADAYGSGGNYGAIPATGSYVYSNNQTTSGYSATGYASNYNTSGSSSHQAPNSGVSSQKSMSSLKDLQDSSSSQQLQNKQVHGYDALHNVSHSGNLGVSNSTVTTTSVLKNSLSATGKSGGIPNPNVPPGVPQLLGTQYIMSQAGLPAFYPVYDMQVPTGGRDQNFAYSTPPDVKYTRADGSSDGSSVASTQASVSQTHSQPIFGQFPPGYGFFYTGVNMMPQPSLYGAAAPPIFPVTPASNSHSHGSASSGFAPKGSAAGYGVSSHPYASAAYDPLSVAQHQDYVKQGYVPSASQQVKGMSGTGVGDMGAANASMYGKSHSQMSKSYDKQAGGYQSASAAPFNMATAGQTGGLAASQYAAAANQYIPVLPHTQPSMLHHGLQGDGSQMSGNSMGQRSMSQQNVPKGPTSGGSKYPYNWS